MREVKHIFRKEQNLAELQSDLWCRLNVECEYDFACRGRGKVMFLLTVLESRKYRRRTLSSACSLYLHEFNTEGSGFTYIGSWQHAVCYVLRCDLMSHDKCNS